MGSLIYGPGIEYVMEDRTLSHMKIAVGAKLRRQESFFLSWVKPVGEGSGRVSLWMSPSIPMTFTFSGGRPPTLNRVWLDALSELSHTPRGMILITEAEAEALHRSRQARDEAR